MKSSAILNGIIVFVTVGLVVGPFFRGFRFSEEVAKWHLAAAANAAETDPEAADASLEKARAASPKVEELIDYWIVVIERALKDDQEALPNLLAKAVSKNSKWFGLAVSTAIQLEMDQKFILAIKTIERSASESIRSNPSVRNMLAYWRSLGDFELEKALADVNIALESVPENPTPIKLLDAIAYRDTRGWVLHKLGRNEEALEDANFAVEERIGLDNNGIAGWINKTAENLGLEEPATDNTAPASDTEYNLGVLRYHRAKILEALERMDEANKDFDWLKKHNLPIDDSLR